MESAVVDGNECDSSGYRAGSVILKKINNKAEKSIKWGNEAWMRETEVSLLHVSRDHLITRETTQWGKCKIMNDLEAHQDMLGFSNVATFLPAEGGCLILQYMEE